MKNIIISFIISLLTCLCGMGINYYWFTKHNWLKFAFRTHCGEITIENGFGLEAVHTYAMSPEEVDAVGMKFSIALFIIWLLVIWLITFIIVTVVSKIFKK